MEQGMKWIKCSDRLPEGKILITDGKSIEFGHYDGKNWYIQHKIGDCIKFNGELTHWMPLPRCPEKQSIDNQNETK
jgi:hypothetical protein